MRAKFTLYDALFVVLLITAGTMLSGCVNRGFVPQDPPETFAVVYKNLETAVNGIDKAYMLAMIDGEKKAEWMEIWFKWLNGTNAARDLWITGQDWSLEDTPERLREFLLGLVELGVIGEGDIDE